VDSGQVHGYFPTFLVTSLSLVDFRGALPNFFGTITTTIMKPTKSKLKLPAALVDELGGKGAYACSTYI